MLLENISQARFEGYSIDRLTWTLTWQDEPIALNRKSFDLLIYLIDQRDRVSSKEELLWALWPDQFVEESNLTQQIFLLRSTGDVILDGALFDALRMDLAQSPVVTVVSPARVRATLAEMKHKPDERMTPAISREVCERTCSLRNYLS